MSRIDDVRDRYQKFSQGDVDGALDNWSEDFTWDGGNSTDVPGGGVHEGRDAARQALQQAVGAWDEFQVSADEFFENGDTVIVLAHNTVTKGGTTEEVPVVHIWRYRGDEACRLQISLDTLQTARLLGVA
jgi:ketosteroid isomerase-like protein